MAEERLYLVDEMSPSLRRIAQEADRLNRRVVSLQKEIKSLEKPTRLTQLRRELKEVKNEAKLTEKALKEVATAQRNLQTQYSTSRNAYLHQRLQALNQERLRKQQLFYGPNVEYSQARNAYLHQRLDEMRMQREADSRLRASNQAFFGDPLRRQRMIYENGRVVRGLSFDERVSNALNKSVNKSRLTFDKLQNPLSTTISRLASVGIALATFSMVVGGVTDSLKSFIKPQDEYTGALTRVALTSDKKYTPTQMMDNLYDTAMRTRADSQGTISLYNRIAMSGVRATNDQILRFVETFNKTMAISGTTAQENRAVMLQLAQGMGSNRLGGDEFRSIAEQAPMFKYMLARGMNVNPGALKQMGAEGKLTADAIMKAMEAVQDQVDEIFKDAPWTIGQLWTILQTKWDKLITHQMTGYIKLRDLLRDFVSWLDTLEGQRFMNNLVTAINNMVIGLVNLIRKIAPFIQFLINHIPLLVKLTQAFLILWTASVLRTGILALVSGFIKMGEAIKTAWLLGVGFLDAMQTGFTALAGFMGITFSSIMAICGAIVAVIAACFALKKLNDEFDPVKIRQDQNTRNARARYNRDVDSYINQQLTKEFGAPNITYMGVPGKTYQKTAEQIDREQRLARRRLELQQQGDFAKRRFEEAAEKGTLLQFNAKDMNPMQDYLNDQVKPFLGAMNSSTNIPMTPGLKNINKVNEVGRINEDVNLNTESIQMMKAIAERQWYMQNEVTVPQKVEITVDKSTNLDPESFANDLTTATQLAIASSMRGEARA